jgi:phospholipid transport system substrate-binding protein
MARTEVRCVAPGLAAVTLLLWLATLSGVAFAEAAKPDEAALVAAPREVVESTINRVLVILNEDGLSSAVRRARIEAIAFDVFDFATMGKLVLARNWKKFDPEQRKSFIAEFKQHLSRNYGSRLDRYQQTAVDIVGTRVEPRNDVTVLSKVVGGQFDGIEMNYRVRERKGSWRVIDVVIEGVSLIANFRAQFVEVIGNRGPDALLELMREKNAEPPEPDAPAAAPAS